MTDVDVPSNGKIRKKEHEENMREKLGKTWQSGRVASAEGRVGNFILTCKLKHHYQIKRHLM